MVGLTINYTYTLTDNVDNDTDLTPYESFAVKVADSDGNPADDATATLRIDIVDDAPIARPDVDSVTEDGALVADGNLITGSGGSDANASDGVADTQGADGAFVSLVDGTNLALARRSRCGRRADRGPVWHADGVRQRQLQLRAQQRQCGGSGADHGADADRGVRVHAQGQ